MTSDLIYIISCMLFQEQPGLFLEKIENVLKVYQKPWKYLVFQNTC